MPNTAIEQHDERRDRLGWMVLFLQMLVVTGILWVTKKLTPEVVADTLSYESFPWQNLTSALGDIRTPGYPLFLKLASLVGQQHALVPTLQLLVYFTSVALMFRQLREWTGAVAGSVAAASSLVYANILHGYVATIATDTLAAGLGIAAVAMTIGAVANPQPSRMLVVGLIVSLGWLTRPAYLFLLILCPLLTTLLPQRNVPFRQMPRIQLAGVMFACCLAPLLLYCGLRWAVVGQFGIVSFGGYNLIGVTGQFLEDSDLAELPDDLRPLAEAALKLRRETSPRGDFASESKRHYLRMENEYDPTIWSDFVPAAQSLPAESPVNVRLRRLGTALVLQHPRDYGIWLVKAVRQAAKKLLWDFLDNPIYLLASLVGWMLVPFMWGYASLSRRITRSEIRVLTLSLVLCTAYASLNLVMVILVCPPLGRFTDAAGVLLGMPLFSALIASRGSCWIGDGDSPTRHDALDE